VSMVGRSELMGREGSRAIWPRLAPWALGAWLVMLLWCTLFAESAPQTGNDAAARPAAKTASSVYEQYRAVVERNIFSSSARSPHPPAEQREQAAPPPPPAGAEYVLTGVVAGGEPAVALVEENGAQTRVYQVGEDTPAGRVAAIEVEGVRLTQGESQKFIRVGYTLAGERSAKLDTVVTTLAYVPVVPSGGGGRARGGGAPGGGGQPGNPGGQASDAAAAAPGGGAPADAAAPQQAGGSRGRGRAFGGGGAGGGAPAAAQNAQPNPFAGLSQDQVLQRMRQRRMQQMGGGTGGP
jgi:hypothetical protein